MQIEKTTQHRGEDETKRSGNLDRKYRGEPDGYRRCTCDLFVPGGYLYRSLHLIVEIPIFLSNEKKYMKVEVQFRTIAMDFWASLDHKLKYKKDNLKHPEIIAKELKKCADTITAMDYKMQEIRSLLE